MRQKRGVSRFFLPEYLPPGAEMLKHFLPVNWSLLRLIGPPLFRE